MDVNKFDKCGFHSGSVAWQIADHEQEVRDAKKRKYNKWFDDTWASLQEFMGMCTGNEHKGGI